MEGPTTTGVTSVSDAKAPAAPPAPLDAPASPIKFESVPVVEGPIFHFNSMRASVLENIVRATEREISSQNLESLLGEALYLERARLKRNRPNIFTRHRAVRDRRMLGYLHAGMLKGPGETDRKALLAALLGHYAEEIGSNFNVDAYKFATKVVPWGFSWLLNAASVQRFLPWGMTQSLESRLRVVGEIAELQALAKKGTILLVPTHQSNIDSVLLGYVIYLMSLPPFAYGAGLNLFSNPVLSFFMSNLGAYTVDRQKTNTLYKILLKNYSTEILRRGVHSIFFPGGGRSRSGAIESKVKLGLLGTALEAQTRNLIEGKPHPNVYVVPMVMSYHFVLEASSLVEDYLAEAGKHRFILQGDESFQALKIVNFFWKFFSTQSTITVRIGKALDVFGNRVDAQDGLAYGPNGTIVDPRRLLTTAGELRPSFQRDHEYTRILGARLVERFHADNTVLTSHAVALAFFEALRKRYPDLDLYRFLRLTTAQRSIPYAEFLAEAREVHSQLLGLARDKQAFHLSPEFTTGDTEDWVRDGVRHLGILHEAHVVRVKDGVVWTEDMNLLYYYRNRLAGYGLSVLARKGRGNYMRGATDAKGFLV